VGMLEGRFTPYIGYAAFSFGLAQSKQALQAGYTELAVLDFTLAVFSFFTGVYKPLSTPVRVRSLPVARPTIKVYRKMSAREAMATFKTGRLQPKIKHSNGKKYLSESSKMVDEFHNGGVPKGTTEVKVEFEMDAYKYESLISGKVHQNDVGSIPGGKSQIEYHYENLSIDGPEINIGVPDNLLPAFNDGIVNINVVW